MVRNYKELDVWKNAMDLVEAVYSVTAGFSRDEIYGLTSQIRRAVVSVASNIAEGCGRRTDEDFISFLYNALGSIKEVGCQLMIAKRLGYLDNEEFEKLENEADKLAGMLMRFIKYVSAEKV